MAKHHFIFHTEANLFTSFSYYSNCKIFRKTQIYKAQKLLVLLLLARKSLHALHGVSGHENSSVCSTLENSAQYIPFWRQSHQLYENTGMLWGNHVLCVTIIVFQPMVSSHIATNAALWWKVLLKGEAEHAHRSLWTHTAALILKLSGLQKESKCFASWQSSIMFVKAVLLAHNLNSYQLNLSLQNNRHF